MAIKQYDPIIAVIRAHLLSNSELTAWERWTTAGEPDIYPGYISFVDGGNYPAITITRDYGMVLRNRTGHSEFHYYIHGWFKPSTDETATSPVSDAAYLMNLVVESLSDSPVFGKKVTEFDMCRLFDSRCPCYDKETRTTFFMTDWRIKASNNLMYA